jgi:hypothetical protein
MMSTPVLLQYLLDNRHRFNNKVLIDCLALASHGAAGRRIMVHELEEVLQVQGFAYVSVRLRLLKRAGLVDYTSGHWSRPGYVFHRVGPAPSAPAFPPPVDCGGLHGCSASDLDR